MTKNLEDLNLARRDFLAKCGQYALVTPPAVTLMLSASGKSNYALALSGSVSDGGRFGRDAGNAGGSGSFDPGILQTRGGSATTEFGAGNTDMVCRTSRATPSRWRETACTRPDSPGFELTGPIPG